MITAPMILTLTLITFVVSVAVVDSRTHRIPNVFVATAAVLGISAQLLTYGWEGGLAALGGLAVGFTMFLPFYLLRAFGAGDVKAMAAIGVFLGPKLTALAVALTLIAGALLGLLVVWITKASAAATLYRVVGVLVAPLSLKRAPPGAQQQRFPYGVAIAAGVLATVLLSARPQFIN